MKISRRKRRQRNVSAEKKTLEEEGQNWQWRKDDEWTHLESLNDPVVPASLSLTDSFTHRLTRQ